MAKNQEASIRPSKRGDSFLTRPKRKFKGTAEQNFRPSQSGGGDFFVKPSGDRFSKKPTKKFHQEAEGPQKEKKPFDKKKYRLQKYSKKYKLQQWEEKRKTAILRGYYKQLKDDEPKVDVKSIYEQYKDDLDSDNEETNDKTKEENENNLNVSINQASSPKTEVENVPRNSKERKGKAFSRAYQEFQRIKDEKKKKREEMLKKKAEKEEALQAYKKKKTEKFKKLSRKTKKGQPIMKERLEMLLEKIQSSMN